jgi:hypothetical protein
MGQDAKATICFGVMFDSEDMVDEENEIFMCEYDWENEYAKSLGIVEPEEDYEEGNTEVIERYRECWRKKREAWEALGVEIVTGGYGGNDQIEIVVAPKKSVIKTWWDSPSEVDPETLKPYLDEETRNKWTEKIKELFKTLGLRYDEGDAKLYLVAYYG